MKTPSFFWLATTLALTCFAWSAFGFVIQPAVISNDNVLNRGSRFDGKSVGVYQQAESTWTTHVALTRQRRSVANVQTQGIFGLGGLEIAVILIAVAFIIGPEKIGSMAGQLKGGLDDIPDELKKIPEEFQKGLEEGETNARARNAKTMKPPPKNHEK